MSDRESLLQEARDMGLNPHHATGAEKLAQMIAEAKDGDQRAPKGVRSPANGFTRVKVRARGADKICTGERAQNKDVTYPEGAVFDLPDDLAEHYLAKDWVDRA
jgi:hypothetical protein